MLYHRFLEGYPELGCGQSVIKHQQEAAGPSLPLQIAHPLQYFRPQILAEGDNPGSDLWTADSLIGPL